MMSMTVGEDRGQNIHTGCQSDHDHDHDHLMTNTLR